MAHNIECMKCSVPHNNNKPQIIKLNMKNESNTHVKLYARTFYIQHKFSIESTSPNVVFIVNLVLKESIKYGEKGI